jgi:hypothetical protein
MTPESPVITRDDQIRIHKQHTDLQMEVATLTQQLQTLHIEAQKVKAGLVSQGELTLLKANIRMNLSTSNSTRVNDLMAEFVETVRESSAISANCGILEQMIVDEANHRQQIVSEYTAIADTLSFADVTICLPKIVRHDPAVPISDTDSKRNEHVLNETRSGILSLAVPRQAHDLEPEAALEIARNAEAQWNLRSAGTYSLRNEIQRLQRAASEGEALLRKTQIARDAEEQKRTQAGLLSHQEEVEVEAAVRQASLELKRESEELDDELGQLKQRLNASAEQFDRLRRELLEIDQSRPLVLSQESSEEEDLFDFEDATDEPNPVLIRQKAVLKREVADLGEALKRDRRAAKHREAVLFAAIKKLKGRLKGNRTQIKIADDSPITDELHTLINRIDNSIVELQREFA